MAKNRRLMLESEIDKLFTNGYSSAHIQAPALVPRVYSIEYERQVVEEPKFERDVVYTFRFVIEKQVRVPEGNKPVFNLIRKTLTSGILDEVYGEVVRELVNLDYDFAMVIGKYGRDKDVINIYNKIQELIGLMTVERE